MVQPFLVFTLLTHHQADGSFYICDSGTKVPKDPAYPEAPDELPSHAWLSTAKIWGLRKSRLEFKSEQPGRPGSVSGQHLTLPHIFLRRRSSHVAMCYCQFEPHASVQNLAEVPCPEVLSPLEVLSSNEVIVLRPKVCQPETNFMILLGLFLLFLMSFVMLNGNFVPRIGKCQLQFSILSLKIRAAMLI